MKFFSFDCYVFLDSGWHSLVKVYHASEEQCGWAKLREALQALHQHLLGTADRMVLQIFAHAGLAPSSSPSPERVSVCQLGG